MTDEIKTVEGQDAAPLVEEVASAAKVQPEEAVEVPVADKVVEESEKPVGESKEAEATVETDDNEAAAKEKSETESKEAGDSKVPEEKSNGDADKVDKKEVDESNKDEAVVESNGVTPVEVEKNGEAVVEETNGVCKRKAENGAEAVEDEKSPKKAKVVDEDNQAPVEETAA